MTKIKNFFKLIVEVIVEARMQKARAISLRIGK